MANAAAVIQTRDILIYEKTWATGNALPADTVVWGTAWSGYTDLGYTDGGVEFRAGVDFADVNVDQSLDPVYQVPTGRDLGARFNMAEVNAVNFQLASGMGTVTTVAPSTGVRGHDDLTITGTITQTFQTLGIDVLNPGDSQAVRILLKKVFPTGSQTLPFRPTDKAVISYDARAFPDTTASNLVAILRDVIPGT